MIEFMDEDELLAEFHKAGIWLEGEREALTHARLLQNADLAVEDVFEKLAHGHAALSDMHTRGLAAQQRMSFFASRARVRAPQQQAIIETGPDARGGTTSLLGGLFGGLF